MSRRLPRLIAKILLSLAAIPMVAVLALWGAANTAPGQRFLAARMEAALSGPGAPATVSGLHGTFPQDLRLDELILTDAEGTWLRVRSARLHWRPLALVTGELSIAALTAEAVTVRRTPPSGEPAAQPAEPDAGGIPRLPLDVRVDELAVDKLVLGAALVGQRAVLTVAGKAAAPAEGALTSTLKVERRDRAGDRAAVKATYHPTRAALTLDARVEGAAGGMITGLLGLPGERAMRVRVTGDGPLRQWHGSATLRIGDTTRADLDLAVRDGPTLHVTGSIRPGDLAPPTARDVLGGPISVDLALARTGPMAVRLDGSRFTTPTMSLALSGRVDAAAGTLTVSAETTVEDAAPLNALIAPVALDRPRATLTAEGPFAAPTLSVDARARRVEAAGSDVEGVHLTATYTPGDGPPTRGRLNAELTARHVRPAMPELAAFAGQAASLRVDGDIDLATGTIRNATATLESAGTTLRVSGGGDPAAGRASASVRADIAALSPLTAPLGLDLGGGASIQGLVETGPDGGLSAQLTGKVTGAAWPAPALTALLGDAARLAGTVAITPQGGVTARRLSVAGDHARVTGKIKLPANGDMDGTLRLAAPDLTVLADPLGLDVTGKLDGTVRLGGTPAAPAVSLDATVQSARLAGTSLGTLTLAADSRPLTGPIAADVKLGADATPIGPVSARAGLKLGETDLRASGLQVETDGITARSKSVSVPLGGGPIAGTVTAEVRALGPLGRRFGVAVAGGGRLTVELAEDQGQAATVTANLANLALPGSGVRAKTATLKADLDRLFTRPEGRVRARVNDAASGPVTIRELAVTASGTPADAEVEIAADGSGIGPYALAATARVSRGESGTTVRLRRLDGSVQEVKLGMAQPATITLGPPETSVRDLALGIGGGTVTVDGTATPDTIDLGARVRELPLDVLRLALPRPALTGTLNAELNLSGSRTAPEGTLSLTARDIAVQGADLPPMTLDAAGTLRGDAVRVDVSLGGLTKEPVALTGRLPARVNLADGVTLAMRRDAPVDAKLTWAGNVAPLMPFVPISGHALAGQGTVEARLAGTLNDPRIDGFATLKNATYENLTHGTLLRDLDLRAEGSGDAVRVTKLTARAGSGRIEGSGEIIFGGGGSRVDIQLKARNARLIQRDEITARTDADLTLTGSLTDLMAEGSVRFERGNITIPKRLPPSVQTLDVREVGGDGATPAADAGGAPPPPRKPEAATPPTRIGLDIAVKIPNRLFVRGNGLDTEWRGDLTVTGTAAQPVVRGKMSVIRGQLAILNRVFKIEEGVISFDGGRRIAPDLNVRATSSGQDITATVHVTGSASQPEIELSSTPDLPRDAILSRLLFGKDPTELGALETAQLATAVAQLSRGGMAGGGFVDRIRGMLGVDVLRLSGSDGRTGVTAGTYVTRDVYVGVQQGLTADSSNVRVELGVTDNISVESNVGASGESEVGIKLKWDY